MAVGAENAPERFSTVNYGMAGIAWFGIAALADVKDAIKDAAASNSLNSANLLAAIRENNETAEQLRLHAEVVRKVKEVEHRRAQVERKDQRRG